MPRARNRIQTQPEFIRAVFSLYGGRMTIHELVERCLEYGVFDASRVQWRSMASACRRALNAVETETELPFAVRLPRRRKLNSLNA